MCIRDSSNLLLYGDTTDVAAAKAAGVNIALAPDWSPSGSKSPLHELKVADLWDDEILGDIFTDEEMVRMVTSNAADATNWQEHVGRIAPGMAADLAVIDSNNLDPYRNLIDAVAEANGWAPYRSVVCYLMYHLQEDNLVLL